MKATLKINGENDFVIEDDVISIGRASDNKIALADDSNVSRYHAEIENREGEFWLVELGSSNGTTVNDKPLETEILLQDGDSILLGGTSEIEFFLTEERAAEAKNLQPPRRRLMQICRARMSTRRLPRQSRRTRRKRRKCL